MKERKADESENYCTKHLGVAVVFMISKYAEYQHCNEKAALPSGIIIAILLKL